MKKIKILFADDHAIVRDGLRSLFNSNPDFLVVGEATDGIEAIKLVSKYKPNVAILDISMPNMNGIEASNIIKANNPETKILILTIHESEEYVREMIQAGADGYVVKNAEKQEIFDGVRAVINNETFFSSAVSKVLLEGIIKRTRGKDEIQFETNINLTKRENEILCLIAEGYTSKAIGEKLFISLSTVNSHRMNIMKKLNVHDTASLVKYAIQNKLINI